jgi:hypothetical protein
MKWFAALSLVAVVLLSGKPGDSVAPASTSPSASDLVKRLGSESFEVRQAASRELLRLGQPAATALRAGLNDPDPEIRRSCESLLPLALRSDQDIRLEAFLAAEEDRKALPLVGWSRFRQLAGHDLAARRLFVELYRTDRALLVLLEKDSTQVGAQLAKRCQDLTQRFGFASTNDRPLSCLGEVAGLLLAAACSGPKLDMSSFFQVTNVFHQPAVRAEVVGNPAVARLLVPLLTGRNSDQGMMNQAFYLARSLGFKDLIENTLKPEVRRQVAAALANPGDFNKIQHAVNLCQQLDMRDAIVAELRPVVRKLVESAAAPNGDRNQFHQLLYLVRVLDLRDVVETTLRPAVARMVLEAAEPPGDLTKFQQALSAAQILQMQNEIDTILKPAIHRQAVSLTRLPFDMNRFHQVMNMARSLRLQETIDTVLKPWAVRQVIATLEESDDLNRISEVANLAKNIGLQDTLEETLKPAISQLLASTMTSSRDLNRLTQAYHLAQNLNLREAVENTIKPALRQALLSARAQPADQAFIPQVLSLAGSLQMKEGLPVALKVALSRRTNPWTRGEALLFVARLGDKDQVGKLEVLLKDSTRLGVMGLNNITITTQVRDLALATMLTLSGQPLQDYGFPFFKAIPGADLRSNGTHCAGFVDDEGRAAALKKWKDWTAEQKK